MTTLAPPGRTWAARRAVAACGARIDAGPVCMDSVALMTSEVVTNAMRHGSDPVTFGVDFGSERLRVEVGDDSRSTRRFARSTALPREDAG